MMAGNFVAILVAATLGQFPPAGPYAGGYGAPYQGPPPGAYQGAYQGGPAGGGGPGSSQYGPGAVMAAPNSTQAFNTGDPFYPYDYEPNWTHGYIQEIPAYGGYHFFRPYNYKNVMPQSQVSAAWGNAANMPYSHQYFDKVSGHPTVWSIPPASNLAKSPQDLNAQIANVGKTPIARRKPAINQEQLVQRRSGQSVMPAGHREE